MITIGPSILNIWLHQC